MEMFMIDISYPIPTTDQREFLLLYTKRSFFTKISEDMRRVTLLEGKKEARHSKISSCILKKNCKNQYQCS
ncbi:hypothetical protein TNCT_590331 [Trichonephila clavata]|uniref:Uncharacterized protein n=1 Tax=Trichonephila clavata TaxID=2740835 RepID=A0A8X6GKZ8_TRICU|nr:hypothetical protein TNCT_590331 [Trichonephila clavata]